MKLDEMQVGETKSNTTDFMKTEINRVDNNWVKIKKFTLEEEKLVLEIDKHIYQKQMTPINIDTSYWEMYYEGEHIPYSHEINMQEGIDVTIAWSEEKKELKIDRVNPK